MSIYTKTGDKGMTGVYGGKRVKKYDIQVEVTGALDEANAFVGVARDAVQDVETRVALSNTQLTLYSVMAYLAGAELNQSRVEEQTAALEKMIDALDKTLPKLTKFVLPQGGPTATALHVARVTVRDAERRLVLYLDSKEVSAPEDATCIQYLNRLSDALFMLARKYSKEEQIASNK
ncbi:MAG: cob(I)yrinic acid a,c-diamide adenosyltransferase [Weeksellaceae bacterium]